MKLKVKILMLHSTWERGKVNACVMYSNFQLCDVNVNITVKN